MNLAPKASRGYAMAVLLVAMSVMAVLLSVALPTWTHLIRREKEEELIFRGQQYARALAQYSRRFANASPASLDVLIEQRMLRKKFKDPLSPNKDGEFQLLYLNQSAPAGGANTVGGGAQGSTGALGTKPSGGIAGVASKNTGTSLRIYQQKTRYNEWHFVGMEQGAAGAVGGGRGGGRGGPGDGRGGPGGRGTGDSGRGDRGSGPIGRPMQGTPPGAP